MKTKDYIVTKKAGRAVAGRVVAKGDILKLTPIQAEYELLLGTIVEAAVPQEPVGEMEPAPKQKIKSASKAG